MSQIYAQPLVILNLRLPTLISTTTTQNGAKKPQRLLPTTVNACRDIITPEFFPDVPENRSMRYLMICFCMFETMNLPQLYKHGRSALNTSLSSAANRVEEHSLKYVAVRGKMTRFWMATWDRMSQRHVLRLLISLPHALIIAVRDLRMSIMFAWHIAMKTF